ncbi:hypothetical protein [Rickettsiales endosymbiont of Stachyamoeba lipophora]|uniref:hypothetical protein n=1 Tax=Rickettsiales endosymbiont of Stachyamoeba lipophora TaxID=2486578 RepID=UPI000F64F8EF|nr:hypothetical protein [Rickettsiales endosymbiont of Stachyamoeba lipophora]AZL15545.1 hypothetical protein EF513_03130 [Rickettsiales endosymbiont of Stachyamoeba lipophora]
MYDSSKTKLLKQVFDHKSSIDIFVDLASELQAQNNLEKIYSAQLEKVYLQFKKVFRDKYFKKFCDEYSLLDNKKGIDFEDQDLVNALKVNIISGIKAFAYKFNSNRLLEISKQKSLKFIAYEISEQTINQIKNDVLVVNHIKDHSSQAKEQSDDSMKVDLVIDKVS